MATADPLSFNTVKETYAGYSCLITTGDLTVWA